MDTALEALRYISAALFVVLAFTCWRRWFRTRHRAAMYAGLTFAILAVSAPQDLGLPSEVSGGVRFWVAKAVVALLALFPFFLYRFATAFVPVPRVVERVAVAMTALVVAATIALPEFPTVGEPRTPLFEGYAFALLVQWTLLSVIAAGRLWRAGQGQPGVASARMRMLALAASFMNVALIFGGVTRGPDPLWPIVTQGVATFSAVLFYFGFEPPNVLRMAWRRQEEVDFRHAVAEVVAAGTPAQVASKLLPHVANLLGARHVSLLDHDDVSVAEYAAPSSGEIDDASEEMRLPFSHGTLLVAASPYTPFFGEDEVEIVQTLGTLLGIALERSELLSLQQLVLKNAGEGIFGIDTNGCATFVNPSGAEMLGFEIEELLGVPIHTKIHHSHPDGSPYDEADCPMLAAMVDGWSRTRDSEVLWRKDGSSLPVEYTASPIRDGNRVTGTVVIFSDISERKMYERAVNKSYERERTARIEVEAANEELESFVYTVSHDLNSPLVSITGFLEYVRSDYGDSLPDQGRLYLERMAASARYMQALIRDLLEFSRVGRTQTDPEPVALNDVVTEVVDQIRASQPHLRLELEDLPVVLMNPVRARQMIANLLNNVARYAGNDPVARIAVAEVSGDRVCLTLSDNGPGIPPEQRERVFGVFERLAPKHVDDGTGMGLAICKRIVESTGGQIWIEDSEAGTDMRLTLPLVSSKSELETV